MSVDSGLWYSYSEQPGVRRNSLVHVGTALRISEQPDVCRNSLTYVFQKCFKNKRAGLHTHGLYDPGLK
jgi:hypothetical protein